MGAIILEIQTRTLNQYHTLDTFPVTLGRALDNDIIISDPSVSPYHAVLDQDDEGQLTIQNLSEENGTRLNSLKLRDYERHVLHLPSEISLAHRRMKVLDRDTPVAATSISACKGMFALFCNPIGAGMVVLLSLLVVYLETHFNSEYENALATNLSTFLPSVWSLLAICLLVAGLTRLAVNRWEIGPSMGIAALFLMIPHLLRELGHWLSYLFTADWPMDTLLILNQFFLLPILLFFFIHRVHNTRVSSALGLSLLLSAPLLVFQVMEAIDNATLGEGFSEQLAFNRTVSSLDIRLESTVSPVKFLTDVRENLGGNLGGNLPSGADD